MNVPGQFPDTEQSSFVQISSLRETVNVSADAPEKAGMGSLPLEGNLKD